MWFKWFLTVSFYTYIYMVYSPPKRNEKVKKDIGKDSEIQYKEQIKVKRYQYKMSNFNNHHELQFY